VTLLDSHNGAPTRYDLGAHSFPGYGEGAPLELPSTPDVQASILSRFLDGTHHALSDALVSVGNCARPIRLTGSSATVDAATGEVVSSFSSADAPLGELLVPCGNRRAHVCPACSRVYARDTFELVRAGVVGGKTIPASVAQSPLLFVTLTAPSFGLVHGVREKGKRCRPRSSDRVETCPHGVRLACQRVHDEDDPTVGAPLCSECYDWTSAVVWQWHAPALWSRTTTYLRRALADRLGVPRSRLREVAAVQFAKVAEYQARGLVHFHAMIRLDGPDGPGSTPPLTGDDLAAVVRDVIPTVTVTAPPAWETDTPRVLAWGAQVDVRTITNGPADLRSSDELSAEQVAGYLAKYATKDVTNVKGDNLHSRPQLARMRQTCDELHAIAVTRAEHRRAGQPSVVQVDGHGRDPYALLGQRAHMLGFRGHFSTKSRRYSVTLGRLRRARQRFQRLTAQAQREGRPLDTRDLERRLLADDEDETTLVIGSWVYAGTGWPRPGDAALATAAAARAREYDLWRVARRKTTTTH